VRQSDQSPNQVRSASRHSHVGQDEGRAVLTSGRQGVVAVGRLTDDAEIRFLLQQPGKGESDLGIVVRDDDGDLVADSGRHRCTFAHLTPNVLMRAHHVAGARALRDTRLGGPVRVRLGT